MWAKGIDRPTILPIHVCISGDTGVRINMDGQDFGICRTAIDCQYRSGSPLTRE